MNAERGQAKGVTILALLAHAAGEGGIARFNHDLLLALRALPEVRRVDAVSRDGPGAPSGRVGYVLRCVRAAMAGGPYDAVFCGHLHLAPLAAALARLTGARLWLQLHGIEAWQRPGALRAAAARQAARVTAVSRYTRARFLDWSGVPADRVELLPNTVDERFSPGPRPAALARRLGVEGCRVLLTVARIGRGDRHKGHDKVLAALARLAARRPELAYVIVGNGDDRPRLEAIAREHGIAGRVHFAGQVSDSELPDYYRLADVFVMPSTKEGFGIVFLEAAASGLPVIGGDRDGSADALADGAIGAMVDPDDAAALDRAIEQALDGPRPDAARVAPFRVEAFRQRVAALVRGLDR